MKKYKYSAINLNGKKFEGTFLAENEKDLRRQLAKQNLYLVSARPDTEKSPNPFFSLTGKVPVSELSAFCRQFSIMITSGTSIVDSLGILRSQSFSGYLRKVLTHVFEDVKAGKLLSEALDKHKRVFPDFFRSMVRVGELSGAIDKVLVAIADYYETDARMRARTRSALVYPAVLIVMAIGIIVLMVAFIIPTFQDALSSLEVDMPPLTVALYDMSAYFRANWKTIVLIAVAVVLLWVLFLRSKNGRYHWDKWKFHMPFVGKVVRNNVSARFCRSFSLLVASGMDIVDAMDEVCIVFGNKYVASQFAKSADDVRQGMTLTMALESYKLFPTMLVQMVSVGEKSGELESVLSRSCSYFENQVERSIAAVTALIQPIILCIIGIAVGVLFYAVYAPLLRVMNDLDTSNAVAGYAARSLYALLRGV